jgi:hypothetical protein
MSHRDALPAMIVSARNAEAVLNTPTSMKLANHIKIHYAKVS